MAQSWIEAAGKLALYLLLFYVSASLVAIAFRSFFWRSREQRAGTTAAMGDAPYRPDEDVAEFHEPAAGRTFHRWLDRFFLEYVGNSGVDDLPTPALQLDAFDRRTNQETRTLMNRVELEMKRHGVPLEKREVLLERMRRSVRLEEGVLEVKRRGLEEVSRVLGEERSGLARTISAVLVDESPELVARIEDGLIVTSGAGVEGEEEK